MRPILLLVCCFVMACWRDRLPPEPPSNATPPTRKVEHPTVQRNRHALVLVDVRVENGSGQESIYELFGIVVDEYHVLLGVLVLEANERVAGISVASHHGYGQPEFRMPARIARSLENQIDPRFKTLSVLETDWLPVRPVLLSTRPVTQGQAVEMFMHDGVAKPWTLDHSRINIIDENGPDRQVMVEPTQWSTNAVFNRHHEMIAFDGSLVPAITALLDSAQVHYLMTP